MKAAVRSQYGPPEVLRIEEVEKPTPKDKEVLVKVYAATVNRTDCGILWGRPFVLRFIVGLFNPKPITGSDFAGVIEAIGHQVTAFKVGDRVFGFDDNGLGSHSQYLAFPEDKGIATIPDNINFEQATASIEGSHYAYNFINKIKLIAGQKVLVNGATGAIGSAAVQLLKYYGAYVTAVCDTDNLELVTSLGADRVIDFTNTDFTKDGEKYNYVFDAVGKSRFTLCKTLLVPGGIYISSEPGPNWENLFLTLFTPIFSDKKVRFPVPYNIKKSVLLISELLTKGNFKSIIDRTYSLDKIQEAFHYTASGKKICNVIISPW